jgi:hypothetical protein
MKEFLEKFGLTEILSHFFPGFLALCALLVWVVPDPTAFLGPDLGKNEFLLGALLLISAYAVGLVLNMWGLHGSQAATQTVPWPGGTWAQQLRYFGSWLRWRYVVVAAGIRPPVPAAMLGLLEIHDLLQGVYGAANMPLLLYPTTQLTIFRAAFCERLKERVGVMLAEPEVERRRYVFAIGVALAMMVLSFSALARFALAMVVRIPAVELQGSASWRTNVPFVLLPILGLVAVFSAAQIARTKRWFVAIVLGATAALCVAVPFSPAHLWPWLSPSSSDTALLGLALLAIASVALCFYLKSRFGLARTLLTLFVTSSVCLIAAVVARLPLLWVAGLARWDAVNQRRPLLLLAGGLLAWFVSSKLREVAVRCLERELANTLAIVRLFGNFF